MATCPNCGKQVSEKDELCSDCGYRLIDSPKPMEATGLVETSAPVKDIPKELQKYLYEDEVVEAQFKLKGCSVYATNHRLFIFRGKKIRDLRYKHVSSVEYEPKKYYSLIVGGLILILFSSLISNLLPKLMPSDLMMLLFFVGLLLVIVGLIYKKERLLIHLAGLKPIELEGIRKNLDSLMKIIRTKP
jgi:DNA-directed RNA polymerase subunit RPC12/RpoP